MNPYLFPLGNNTQLLTASVLGIIGAFAITFFAFYRRRMPKEGFFYAVGVVVSAQNLYDIIYHYSWGSHGSMLTEFIKDVKLFDVSGYGGNIDLLWMLMTASVPLIGYKYMHLNKWFWITMGISAVGFVVWILIGFPQFFQPNWCSELTNCQSIINLHWTTETQRMMAGYEYNSLTKVTFMLSIALLFLPSNKDPKT